MFIENVTMIKVDSEAAVLALLTKGSKARSVGETQVHVHMGVLYVKSIFCKLGNSWYVRWLVRPP